LVGLVKIQHDELWYQFAQVSFCFAQHQQFNSPTLTNRGWKVLPPLPSQPILICSHVLLQCLKVCSSNYLFKTVLNFFFCKPSSPFFIHCETPLSVSKLVIFLILADWKVAPLFPQVILQLERSLYVAQSHEMQWVHYLQSAH